MNLLVYTVRRVLTKAIETYHNKRNCAKRYCAVVQYAKHIEQPSKMLNFIIII